MSKRISRIQKAELEPRSRLTDEELFLIALNSDAYPTGYRPTREETDNRVLLLFVRRFQQLDAALETARSKSSDLRDIWDDSEVCRAAVSLNRLFGRYRLTPVIIPSAKARPGWGLRWLRMEGRSHIHLQTNEFTEVLKIKKLAEEGRLSSLKQCANCKRWLFARFSHQKFCSDSCKENFHRTNPQDKARRREWARKNYWLHKTKNVK